ncbi:hypothetical protein GYMLUDRAFT_242866 [Collybiopsis luxurians FD-317 M1]|uniref:Uncharacterized protein n=1 Tax=Collybiopsis luxurians FD-317 M1 TaxID=944289 RepID=A0A0D0CZV9_9AGAR|nr:hypothetical protein GYMLUDRAFT_242866 [Collybiopsis luxurians FD-317 M1]
MPLTLTHAQQAIVDLVSAHRSSSVAGQLLLVVTGASRTGCSAQSAALILGEVLSSRTALLSENLQKSFFFFDEAASIKSYHLMHLSEALQLRTPPDKSSLFFGGHHVILFLNYQGLSDAHYPIWHLSVDDSLPVLHHFTSHFELIVCFSVIDTNWMQFTSAMQSLTSGSLGFSIPHIAVTPSDNLIDLAPVLHTGLKIITTSLFNVHTWNDLMADRFVYSSLHVLYLSNAKDHCVNYNLEGLSPEDLETVCNFMSMGGLVTVSLPICQGMPVTIIGGTQNRFWGKVVDIVLDSRDPHSHIRPHTPTVCLNYPPAAIVIRIDKTLTDGQEQFVTVIPKVFHLQVPNPIDSDVLLLIVY